MMSAVRFSVVVACYNQEGFVREAVESVLAQGHPGTEVIVVDDASRDGTPAVLGTFGDAILFERLPSNRGAAAARNHGAAMARGEYLVFLDGDDVLMPWALDVYDRLITARRPALLFGRSALFHGGVPGVKSGAPMDSIRFVEYEDFLAKDRPCLMNSSTLVVNRSAFWSAKGWSEGIFYQDMQDLVTKLSVAGKTVLVLGPDTVWYRMHGTNAVKMVAPFVEGLHVLLAKARAGMYPGGRERGIARSAWFGGVILYWTRMALHEGLYRDGLKLLASGWWMILLAVVRRGRAWVAGRRPVEVLPLVPE